MSERGLVVRQESVSAIEAALKHASEQLLSTFNDLVDEVNTLTPGWEPTSESFVAHRTHQRELVEGVTRLTKQLDAIRTALGNYREDARQIELDNVTLVN